LWCHVIGLSWMNNDWLLQPLFNNCKQCIVVCPCVCPSIGYFLTWSCQNLLLVIYCKLFIIDTLHYFICGIIACWGFVTFRLWCHVADSNWMKMTNGCNICLIVPSNVLWHTHVLPICWIFFTWNLKDSLLVMA